MYYIYIDTHSDAKIHPGCVITKTCPSYSKNFTMRYMFSDP